MRKPLLGFNFDGLTKTMWLEAAKMENLLTIFKGWMRLGKRRTAGIPFKEFESMVAKIWHAFTCIPASSGGGIVVPLQQGPHGLPGIHLSQSQPKTLQLFERMPYTPTELMWLSG
jgi:hypothetical protein